MRQVLRLALSDVLHCLGVVVSLCLTSDDEHVVTELFDFSGDLGTGRLVTSRLRFMGSATPTSASASAVLTRERNSHSGAWDEESAAISLPCIGQ